MKTIDLISGGPPCLWTSVVPASVTISVAAKDCIYFANQTSPIAVPAGWSAGDYWGDLTDPDTIPEYVDLTGLGILLDITAAGDWPTVRRIAKHRGRAGGVCRN